MQDLGCLLRPKSASYAYHKKKIKHIITAYIKVKRKHTSKSNFLNSPIKCKCKIAKDLKEFYKYRNFKVYSLKHFRIICE